MDDLTDETLMGLPEFRKLLHLSPSTERRMRSEEQDWPPHLVLGRKVFYFRDGVRDFLLRQQDAHGVARPDVLSAPLHQDDAFASGTPAFTVEQKRWLKAFFVHQLGDGS